MIQSRPAVIDSIVRADESLDAAAFAAVLAPGAQFRIGSAPAIVGRESIEDAVRHLFERISTLRHEIGAVWDLDGVLIYEAIVHYELNDGRHLDLPYVNVLRMVGTLVNDYRIYIDLSPL